MLNRKKIVFSGEDLGSFGGSTTTTHSKKTVVIRSFFIPEENPTKNLPKELKSAIPKMIPVSFKAFEQRTLEEWQKPIADRCNKLLQSRFGAAIIAKESAA